MTAPAPVSGGGALCGRQAVVTGAAGGIGRAIVLALHAEGASVHGLDRDAPGLEHLAEEVRAASKNVDVDRSGEPRFTAHEVDLADRAATDRALSALLTALASRCDILVNNAGVSRFRSFAETGDADLDFLFAVNFMAGFRVTRALLPALRASPHASVINVASELALVGQAGYVAYSGTKGAVLAWSRGLAVELAADRIRVNAVCPGPVDTPLLQAEFDTSAAPDAARAAEIASVPLGCIGSPRDIASVVAFLAGDSARFVTGAAWSVDGGKTSR
jgi:NAD(P)-dependent dehydrogenase (short-subunit alcohol dehydrogenase family)